MQESFQLDDVVNRLVRDGVVVVTVTFTQTGVEAYARSVASHPRLNIYPHMSFELSDLSEAFKEHRALRLEDPSTPPSPKGLVEGEKASSKARVSFSDDLPLTPTTPPRSGEERRGAVNAMTVEAARLLLLKTGANMMTRNGVQNAVPQDSLVIEDLYLNTSVLYARMICIAQKIGNVKAIARISTVPGLTVPGAADIDQWWDRATVEQRLTLLSRGKALNIKEALSSLPSQRIARIGPMGGLRSPFRGTPVNLVPVETLSPSDSGST